MHFNLNKAITTLTLGLLSLGFMTSCHKSNEKKDAPAKSENLFPHNDELKVGETKTHNMVLYVRTDSSVDCSIYLDSLAVGSVNTETLQSGATLYRLDDHTCIISGLYSFLPCPGTYSTKRTSEDAYDSSFSVTTPLQYEAKIGTDTLELENTIGAPLTQLSGTFLTQTKEEYKVHIPAKVEINGMSLDTQALLSEYVIILPTK